MRQNDAAVSSTRARQSPQLLSDPLCGLDSRLIVEVAMLGAILFSTAAMIASLCGCVLLTPHDAVPGPFVETRPVVVDGADDDEDETKIHAVLEVKIALEVPRAQATLSDLA
jgi:hypothetical protein